MNKIQKIVKIDNKIIYQNKKFWCSPRASEILDKFDEYEILDYFGEPVNYFDFGLVYNENRLKFIDSKGDLSKQIKINIEIGQEFISLFREEFVRTKTTVDSITIAHKLNQVIPLILTGSFKEACEILASLETDDFLTSERIEKYILMLKSADAIDYNYIDSDYDPDYFITDTYDFLNNSEKNSEENEE